MEKLNWHFVGLAETRRQGENCIQLRRGNLLYYNGLKKKKGERGTGFLIHKNLKSYMTRIDSAQGTDRILLIYLKIKNINTKIILVYAPTASSSKEEIELFDDKLKETFRRDLCGITIIMRSVRNKE